MPLPAASSEHIELVGNIGRGSVLAGWGVVYRRFGHLLASTGHASKAHACYRQSLAAYQSIGDQHGINDATTRLNQRIRQRGKPMRTTPRK